MYVDIDETWEESMSWFGKSFAIELDWRRRYSRYLAIFDQYITFLYCCFAGKDAYVFD